MKILGTLLLIIGCLSAQSSYSGDPSDVYTTLNNSLSAVLTSNEYKLNITNEPDKANTFFISLQLSKSISQVKLDTINLILDDLDRRFSGSTILIDTKYFEAPIKAINARTTKSPPINPAIFILLFILLVASYSILTYSPHKKIELSKDSNEINIDIPIIRTPPYSEETILSIELIQQFTILESLHTAHIIKALIRANKKYHLNALRTFDTLLDPISKVKVQYYLSDRLVRQWNKIVDTSSSEIDLIRGIEYFSLTIKKLVVNKDYIDDTKLTLLIIKSNSKILDTFINEHYLEASYTATIVNMNYLKKHISKLNQYSVEFLLKGKLTTPDVINDKLFNYKEKLALHI